MDRTDLEGRLTTRFDADPAMARVVAREARDLADSGRYGEDFDAALTAAVVAENLADAPDECDLAERWNWWIGSLELSQGGYRRFEIRQGGV